MDIVLEFVDTFIADHAYAYLFPIGYSNKPDVNASAQVIAPCVWQPATKFLNVRPSEAAYMSSIARDNLYRQLLTIFLTTWLSGVITYFICARLSYHLIFDKRYMKHPKFMKNQIWIEIKLANQSLPIIAILMAPLLLLQVRGYTKLYDTTADGPGWWYDIIQVPLFLVYSDFFTYWTHRLSHHPRAYKHNLYMHKLHHRFVVPTPYASYAIHPMEGFALAVPYHVFPLVLPLQNDVLLGMYTFVNLWSIGIHDGKFLSNNRIVNGAACHSLHHTYRNCNYGQYFTLFDRLFGTYREPDHGMFQEDRWLAGMQWKKEFQIMKESSKRNEDKRTHGMDQGNSKNKKYE